jgi:hypothetical protein
MTAVDVVMTPNNSDSIFSITLDDITEGQFAGEVLGMFECGMVKLHLISLDDPSIPCNGPTIVELDVVNYAAIFRSDFIADIFSYIEAALAGSVIEEETGMRTVGAITQHAILAFVRATQNFRVDPE